VSGNESCHIEARTFILEPGNLSAAQLYDKSIDGACSITYRDLFIRDMGNIPIPVTSECIIIMGDAVGNSTVTFECRPPEPITTPTPAAAPTKDSGPNGSAELQAIKDRAKTELNPMNFATGKKAIPDLIGRVIGALLAFAGSIALVLYIYAGAMWMMAGGDPGRVGTAKKVIIWTTLGVVVMLGSYIIVKEIFGLLK